MNKPAVGRSVVIAAILVLGATAAVAAQPDGAIACDGARQDRAACLREAGAAKQERKTGGLTNAGAQDEQDNALARCDAQPAAAR